jgi:hypothetical protein
MSELGIRQIAEKASKGGMTATIQFWQTLSLTGRKGIGDQSMKRNYVAMVRLFLSESCLFKSVAFGDE